MQWFKITDSAKTQMENLLSKNPDKYAVSLAVKGGVRHFGFAIFY